MKIAICVLTIIILVLYRKICRLQNKLQSQMKNYQKIIDEQNKRIQAEVHEKERMHAQVVSFTQEIQELKSACENAKRELEFYKNIETDSGNLNSSDDNKQRDHLLEQVAEQIKTARTWQAQADSLDNIGLDGARLLLDPEQTFALSEMEHSCRNYFITGKAGTGKSFLLDAFRKTTEKSHVILAPTGIAALNVSGATLHSTFGYDNLVKLDVDNISEESIRLKSEKRLILQRVSTIIIDEISMVRADTFDKIDRILKVLNQSNLPFGGKQVLLFGDLFQLPPVTKKEEHDYLYDRYGGIYFFCADAYKQGDFKFIELTINHRQKDDAEYFALLNRIREGSARAEDIRVLNSRVVKDPSIYDRFTTLLPTKAEVERLNQYHINQLSSPEYKYQSSIILDKYSNGNQKLEAVFPIASTLRLKKGALVMLVSNDPEHRWVNGTLGIISRLSNDSIAVAINARTYEIHPYEFKEQEITYTNGKITYEDVLIVKQYPIVPAYAITIHKSQGQTYQNIVCDIDRCFANGQAYVALSRCTSIDGLHLKKKISGASIHVDRQVVDFYHEQIANSVC